MLYCEICEILITSFFTEHLRWLLLKGHFRILSNVYNRVFVKIANYQSSKLQSKTMLPKYDFSIKLSFSKWNLSPIISRFPYWEIKFVDVNTFTNSRYLLLAINIVISSKYFHLTENDILTLRWIFALLWISRHSVYKECKYKFDYILSYS